MAAGGQAPGPGSVGWLDVGRLAGFVGSAGLGGGDALRCPAVGRAELLGHGLGAGGRSITGTTLRSASMPIAPARSSRGTVPVRSRIVDGTLSAHGPPSR